MLRCTDGILQDDTTSRITVKKTPGRWVKVYVVHFCVLSWSIFCIGMFMNPS